MPRLGPKVESSRLRAVLSEVLVGEPRYLRLGLPWPRRGPSPKSSPAPEAGRITENVPRRAGTGSVPGPAHVRDPVPDRPQGAEHDDDEQDGHGSIIPPRADPVEALRRSLR